MPKRQAGFPEWKKMNWVKRGFLIIQAINGTGFAVMTLAIFLKMGMNLSSLVLSLFMAVPAALEILGSFYFFKGQRRGYVLLIIAQVMLLFSFSAGDWELEIDKLISLDIWFKGGGNKFGVDLLALASLVLVSKWLMASYLPGTPALARPRRGKRK